jgi:hypothetical protein
MNDKSVDVLFPWGWNRTSQNIKEERHYGFCGLMIKSTRRKSVDKTFSIRGAFSEQKETGTFS